MGNQPLRSYNMYATVLTHSTFAFVANPRAVFAAISAPPVPSNQWGQLYNDQTGELLYDDVTGASLKW